MRKLVFLLPILLFGFNSKLESKQEKINVLFIGNSFTYYHEMPKTLQEMLNETHSNYNIEVAAFPGMNLSDHLNNIIVSKNNADNIEIRLKEKGELTETEKKLLSKKWDIIILQEYPSNYYFPESIPKITIPTIQKIKKIVSNPNCKYINFNIWPVGVEYPIKTQCIPLFNLDWTLENIDTVCSSEIDNLEEEVRRLNQSAQIISNESNLITSDHCNLRYKVMTKLPQIILNEEDHHPSQAGSFLNACQFYKILTNKKVSMLKYNGSLNPKEAQLLKEITDLFYLQIHKRKRISAK